MRSSRDRYLSKREQQLMDIVYERERLTASEATELLPGKPSNSTVRTLLRILEDKGQLRHLDEHGRYVYIPVRPKKAAALSALQALVRTFFHGSVGDVVAALLSEEGSQLSDEERTRLKALIDEARAEGR